MKYIILFLHFIRSLLTTLDLKIIKLALQADVLNVIKIRALFAQKILMPFMETSSKIGNPQEYTELKEELTKFLVFVAQHPSFLENQKISFIKDEHMKDFSFGAIEKT